MNKNNKKLQTGIKNLKKNQKLMKNKHFSRWKFFKISRILNYNNFYNFQNLWGKINYKILNTQNLSGNLNKIIYSQNSSGNIKEICSRTKFIIIRSLYFTYSKINIIYKENLLTHIKNKIINKIYKIERSHSIEKKINFRTW